MNSGSYLSEIGQAHEALAALFCKAAAEFRIESVKYIGARVSV